MLFPGISLEISGIAIVKKRLVHHATRPLIKSGEKYFVSSRQAMRPEKWEPVFGLVEEHY